MRRPLIPSWFLAMIVASMLITVIGTLRQIGPAEPPQVQNKELFDALWIDRYPQSNSESWNGYLFEADKRGISVQSASAYKRTLELFGFNVKGSSLSFNFPHDKRRTDSNFTIEKLKKPTRHFDTQLTLASDPQKEGKNSVYFTGPNLRSLATMPESVRITLESQGFVDTEDGIQSVR